MSTLFRTFGGSCYFPNIAFIMVDIVIAFILCCNSSYFETTGVSQYYNGVMYSRGSKEER
jgi:hypothetical protein